MSVFSDLSGMLAPKEKDKEKLLEAISAKYDTTQLMPFLLSEKSGLTIAAAGAGKTTALLLKLLIDDYTNFGNNTDIFNKNTNVWVATFLNVGAKDIQNKYTEIKQEFNVLNSNANIRSNTLHAEYYRLIRSLRPDVKVLTNSQQFEFIKKAFNVKQVRNVVDTVQVITGMITLYSNLIDKHTITDKDFEYVHHTRESFEKGIHEFNRLKTEAGVVDFDDMQTILYNALCVKKNKEIIDYVQSQYDVIYIDEFQDLSQVQYEILKVQAGKVRKIVAIGDDDQTIYTWRGSDSNIILKKFPIDFQPEIFKLTTNYRCPSNILKPALNVIEENKFRYDKDVKAFKEGGEFAIVASPTLLHSDKQLVDDAIAHVQDGRKVTIISRTNNALIIPLLLLDKQSTIDYNYLGSKVNLKKTSNSRFIDVPSVIEGSSNSIRSLMVIFESFDNSISYFRARQINDKLAASDYNLLELPNQAREDLGFPSTLNEWLDEIKELTEAERFQRVIKQLEPRFKDFTGFALLKAIIDIYEVRTAIGLETIVNKVNLRLGNKENFPNPDMVLTTVHGYKGLENDVILVGSAVDGVFPYTSKTLPKEVLENPDDFITEDLEAQEALENLIILAEEERRLFYIACTRAKEHLTIYTTSKLESMFIKELDRPITEKVYVEKDFKAKQIAKLDLVVPEI